VTADERERRLRSLFLPLAPYVGPSAPFVLVQALWHGVADQLFREHAALLGPDPWRMIRSPSQTVH